MTKVLFITGTDTGVGKTVVTAALAANASTGGQTVAVVKPAQTGVTADEPGDLDDVRRLTGLTDLHEGVRLLEPLAPTTAGRRQGVALPSVEVHAKAIEELAATHDLVLVEGGQADSSSDSTTTATTSPTSPPTSRSRSRSSSSPAPDSAPSTTPA